MSKIQLILAIFGLTGLVSVTPQTVACPLPLPETTVTIGNVRLASEIAATHKARYCGLSRRDKLAAGRAMLFVFATTQTLHFTMRDTRVPLSIAFLDEERRVVDVQDMNLGPAEVLYRSAKPARYALEVRQGWFAKHGIRVGVRAEFTLPLVLRVD